MYYCCKINYGDLGDTVLFLKTESKWVANKWLDEQSNYFSSVIYTEKEYKKRLKDCAYNNPLGAQL